MKLEDLGMRLGFDLCLLHIPSQPKEKKAAGKHRTKVVHPNSRQAAQMVREAHRKERVERYVQKISRLVQNIGYVLGDLRDQ